jgi:hypothetical protein
MSDAVFCRDTQKGTPLKHQKRKMFSQDVLEY